VAVPAMRLARADVVIEWAGIAAARESSPWHELTVRCTAAGASAV